MLPVNTSGLRVANNPASQNVTKFEETADMTLMKDFDNSKENIIKNDYNKNKVLVICGPTATGKTKLALQLAKEFNGELIAADSRQVYVGNDLETGKDKDILGNTKIWLMDIVEEKNDFSVSQWRRLAQEAIKDILARGKLPIVVGGSGLYIKALVENLSDVDAPRDEELRKSNKTAIELFNCLKNIDYVKAASLNNSDRNNPRRLIRAIEIGLHKRSSSVLARGPLAKVRYLQIGLIASKEILEERIKQRVRDRGLSEGFVKKEINIMKKQLVWFKKQPNIVWW